MAGKFEIKLGKTGKFRFNLKASNGQIILSSEAYDSRSSATKGITSVKKNAQNEKRFERKTAKDGSSYFVMKAANGEPVGKSEMYTTARAMENGIASVDKNAPDAPVADGDPIPMAKSASVSSGGSITKMATIAKKPAAKKPAARKAVAKAAVKKAVVKKAVKKAVAKKAVKPAVKKAVAKKVVKKAVAKNAVKKAVAKKAVKKAVARKAVKSAVKKAVARRVIGAAVKRAAAKK